MISLISTGEDPDFLQSKVSSNLVLSDESNYGTNLYL